MKRSKIYFLLLIVLPLYGQSEWDKDFSLGFSVKDFESKINFSGDLDYYRPFTPSNHLNKDFSSIEEFQIRSFDDYFFIHDKTLPHTTINFDKSLLSTFSINKNQWISTFRNNAHYIGLGGNYTLGAMYNYKVGDFLILSAGLHVGKYAINNAFFNHAGVSGNMQFLLGDKVKLDIFGSYSAHNNEPMNPASFGMYPSNYFGGSLELKIAGSFGIKVGMRREYDYASKQWINIPYIMPVLFGTKKATPKKFIEYIDLY